MYGKDLSGVENFAGLSQTAFDKTALIQFMLFLQNCNVIAEVARFTWQ